MKKFKKIILRLGLVVSIFGTVLTMNLVPSHIAAKEVKEEAELRFIFTTDLHGQLNSMSYETGLDYNNGGLSRAYDLIMQARNEMPTDNSYTFDVGDFLYDYTTEYIFSKDQEEIQPIVKAMKLVGYDAITLGNHEFDYGYNYLLNQLKGSGLMDITVVSNVFDSKTGDHTFLENMLITREVETLSGKKANVTVGVIGETIPTLTAKTESYTGILKTEDIVENVKKQSQKLKELGADVIVVLAHSGFGPEHPELNFKNVSYALTKIDEVDVILCGHEHNEFPTTDKSSPYLSLPGVDRSSYLVNGKNIVMASNRGQSIGVVDLVVDLTDDDIEIVKRNSSLRHVRDYKTTENETMRSLYGAWENEFLKYSSEIIGKTDSNETIHNYFGLFQDTSAIQLLNDSKRNHALRYINTEAKKYKDYPVIAVSSYYSYGSNSYLDFVNIKEEFTESDLAIVQPYNNYLYLYTITGAQLKEWLEWSASAFESLVGTTKWKDESMNSIMKTTNLRSLIKEDWLKDWSSFYIFDGIDYYINPTMQARYDLSGNKISNESRVRNITYNGVEVTDDMELILASNKITVPAAANKGIENQYIYKAFYRSQAVLSEYIKQISKAGSIMPTPDYNWKLLLDKNYEFIVNGPKTAQQLAKKSSWFVNEINSINNYTYYTAKYNVPTTDTLPPTLSLVPTVTKATGTGYDVVVDAIDASGIKTVRLMKGDYDLSYDKWSTASVVKGTFSVKENGTFSVYAEDNNGNKIVKKVVIDNISDKVVGVPKVETYTNRKSSIKGTAEPGVTVVIIAETGTYEAKTLTNGSFSYPLPAQRSGSRVHIYAKDEETGRVSQTVSMNVKRTGPNQPDVNHVYNNSEYISGFMNDDDATIIAIIEDMVYVSKNGGKEAYMKAVDIYNPSKTINEVDVIIRNGKFIIDSKPHVTGTVITLYNIDHLGRVSRVSNTRVSEAGPNLPQVYEVLNIEKSITGKVNSSTKNTIFTVYAEVNGNTYSVKSDKSGNFTLLFNEQLVAGQSIYVYATDTVANKERKSAKAEVIVSDANDFLDEDSSVLYLNGITNKDTEISGGYYNKNEKVFIAVVNTKNGFSNQLYEITTDDYGDFYYELDKALPVGARIYAMTRFRDGDIIALNVSYVIPTIPEQPILVEDINNSKKEVYVIADEASLVTVEIGKKSYKSSDYVYNKELDAYVYTVNIGRANSGTKVTIYASNSAGKSEVLESKVIKLAPDAPDVSEINTSTTIIKGSIELLSDKVEDTKVYAKIGSKTYEGNVESDGTFEIKIKKQKANVNITIWGSHKEDRGPLTSVKVVKEK